MSIVLHTTSDGPVFSLFIRADSIDCSLAIHERNRLTLNAVITLSKPAEGLRSLGHGDIAQDLEGYASDWRWLSMAELAAALPKSTEMGGQS